MRSSLIVLLSLAFLSPVFAAEPLPASQATTTTPSVTAPSDYVLVHFILRHDQSRNLAEIQQVMKENKFWSEFPPDGIEIESWYVVMGVGQVVTLRVPPARLREVNLAVERAAWKIFRTEAYPAYDLKKAAEGFRAKAKAEAATAKP